MSAYTWLPPKLVADLVHENMLRETAALQRMMMKATNSFTAAARSFDAFTRELKQVLPLRPPSRGMRKHVRREKAAKRRRG